MIQYFSMVIGGVMLQQKQGMGQAAEKGFGVIRCFSGPDRTV